MESATQFLARRIEEERVRLCEQWLDKLLDLLPVGEREVFPSHDLLDHVPLLLGEIAAYVGDPGENDIGANSIMEVKAGELGELRFRQRASVHQILREYDFLAVTLEDFVRAESARYGGEVPVEVGYRVVSRLHRSVRLLMQSTVDTFVAKYDEAMAQQRQRLEDFNRLVSHEMRGPLNTLQIAASLLDRPAEARDETTAKSVSLIGRAVEQMKRILVDMEALSRTGELPADSPTVQEVEVAAVARDVREQLSEFAAARGVVVRVGEELPTMIVDSARLQMVLANLVTNAIKYSDPEKAERWVEVDGGVHGPDRVEILVRDNGLGIALAEQERVFERFYRAHRHLDSAQGRVGSGLGLSIVRECIVALGGEIGVESAPGQGSVFAVRLPRAGAARGL